MGANVSEKLQMEYVFAIFDWTGSDSINWAEFYHTLKRPGIPIFYYRLCFLLCSQNEKAITKRDFQSVYERAKQMGVQDFDLTLEQLLCCFLGGGKKGIADKQAVKIVHEFFGMPYKEGIRITVECLADLTQAMGEKLPQQVEEPSDHADIL